MTKLDLMPATGRQGSTTRGTVVAARLPRFSPEQATLLNALHRPRPALALSLGERALRLRILPPAEPTPLPVALGLSLGDAPALLRLGHDGLALLTRHLALRAGLETCEPDLTALWLEYALLEWVEPLEARLGVALRLDGGQPSFDGDEALDILLQLEGDGGTGQLHLSLGAAATRAVAPLLDALPAVAPRACSALPVTVQWVAGHQRLRLDELRGLRPGDVVLLERPVRALAAAGRPLAEVEEQGGGLRLVTTPLPGPGDDLDAPRADGDSPRNETGNHRSRDAMAENPRSPKPPPDTVALDGLPMRLVCELGRLELTLGELRELGPGSVLPLTRPREDAVDLVVNGRPLGRGRLVEIGDGLGVQIVRLTGDE
ncbi:type III secretion system cytoplasmic ring protein SctQ [Halomonas sp. MCCC 1A17488]|uniref:type III secretion system cytoplasmic ring protein SctQ n=1 Tax=unclassified Halomonas TaxID=2609666 RepID=UPI0018D22B49|nr:MULTISPECIES: type III secretion system cytoplasmic ring protein SctQ [unclassified Halomonas]MCE8016451.1 type III secretion system cytoplasmic ring protein SctQ [Halomonas sp. MCCC 1A17488]MCG3239784.1 type III secretion system cytoplasmic ring protein SctQ [Halomonas sp. MCCC 1A17488]QPP50315.1 type III secretion system cytoplasmic ring protein SctQ [Halomonas sp. SS10-MC5]